MLILIGNTTTVHSIELVTKVRVHLNSSRAVPQLATTLALKLSAAAWFVAGLMACRNATIARQFIWSPQAAKSLAPETAAAFLVQM